MALRTRWLALVIAFLWGALGSLHPDAVRRQASANANVAPPWLVLAPRRAVLDDGSVPGDPFVPTSDDVLVHASPVFEPFAATSTLARRPARVRSSTSSLVPARSRGPPASFTA